MRCGVLLLAAGAGRRFGSSISKQFAPFHGVPLFVHSLRVFSVLREVIEIVIVVPKPLVIRIEGFMKKIKINKTIHVISGGSYRGESVRNGLKRLTKKVDLVLVHDAARPLLSADVVRRVMTAAQKRGVALAAWPLSDTLKLAGNNGRVKKTIPRESLWCAQTPQAFRRAIAEKCLLTPSPTATDDTELAERHGIPVWVVVGSPTNIKVTYPRDLEIAKVMKGV